MVEGLWQQLDMVKKVMGPSLGLVPTGKLDEVEEEVKWAVIEDINDTVRLLQSFEQALKGGMVAAPPPPPPPPRDEEAERRKLEREQGAESTGRRRKKADTAAAGQEGVVVPREERKPEAAPTAEGAWRRPRR